MKFLQLLIISVLILLLLIELDYSMFINCAEMLKLLACCDKEPTLIMHYSRAQFV